MVVADMAAGEALRGATLGVAVILVGTTAVGDTSVAVITAAGADVVSTAWGLDSVLAIMVAIIPITVATVTGAMAVIMAIHQWLQSLHRHPCTSSSPLRLPININLVTGITATTPKAITHTSRNA